VVTNNYSFRNDDWLICLEALDDDPLATSSAVERRFTEAVQEASDFILILSSASEYENITF